MKKILTFTLVFLLYFLFPSFVYARALLSTETTCTGTDVSVSTTDETVMATQVVRIPQAVTFLVRVRIYFTMTTSAASTTYAIRARRESISGTALGDAIAETVKVTAGGVEAGFFEFTDERSGSFSALTYVSTVTMAGASGTTTVSQNCITVDILQ